MVQEIITPSASAGEGRGMTPRKTKDRAVLLIPRAC